MRLVRTWMVLSAFALTSTFAARGVWADEEFPPPPPSPNGPAYLIISAPDEDFSLSLDGDYQSGSRTILVRIGSFTGGGGILDARFIRDSVPPFAFPEGVSLADLDGNQVTVISSFQLANEQIHFVSPRPPNPEVPVPADIQGAVFRATQAGALDALGTNPTTLDISNAILGYVFGETGTTASDVFQHVFDTPQRLVLNSGVCETEGGLFPHEPSDLSFDWSVALGENDDGDLETTFDVCREVGIDVKPGNSLNKINFAKKKGALKVAFLSSDGFDATDVDVATAEIGGVFAVSGKRKDVNHDGLPDLVLKFKMKTLIEQGVVSCSTTELTMRADLSTDGSCVTGTQAVQTSSNCDCENDGDD